MRIVNLRPQSKERCEQAASLLVESFTHAWPDMDSALEEVNESFAEGAISRVGLGDSDTVLGWVGSRESYGGKVWELHPLVVHAMHRGKGIGRALVQDVEKQVQSRGGLTLWLGTDDEDDSTSLSGIDLYPNVLEHATKIQSTRNHPFRFYEKLGFVVVGLLPDANGFGKPDIFMAKRVGMDVQAKRVKGPEIGQAYEVRHNVFVEEQGIAEELERDALDENAVHVVAYIGGRPVGAGRLVVGPNGGKLGRLAVLAPYRNRGIGECILTALVAEARREGCARVYLHSQVPARSFYEKRGFTATGPVFQEAGIDHVAMELAL